MTASDTTRHETTTSRRMLRRGARILATALTAATLLAFGANGAEAATGKTGTHYRSSAQCKPISSPVVAMQNQIVAAAPTMYAANTTGGLDAQTVSFRQRLLKWNGSSWVSAGSASAVWSGFATDAKAALDFSDGSRTLRLPQITFTIAGPGYYAVVTDYWWKATSFTSGGSNAATALHSPSISSGYCTFSY